MVSNANSGVPSAGQSGSGEIGFSEKAAWSSVGRGWQPVYGGFNDAGFSIEWHDFRTTRALDWGASFHPEGVELCLNLEGEGQVGDSSKATVFRNNTAGFYSRAEAPLPASRAVGQRHQFLTLEFSHEFLQTHFGGIEDGLHPVLRRALDGQHGGSAVSEASRLTAGQQQIVSNLRQPPVHAAAFPLWCQCKALELATVYFFQKTDDDGLFCTRQQRLAGERAEQVIFLLKQNLAQPLTLEELGRKIGCSPFYLSRIFSNHTGQTITQYLRQLRLDRAAELLRGGEFNVTEAALEVGYSSLSHFSQAFHETFGCCPGLYPIRGIRSRVEQERRSRPRRR